MTRYLTLTQMLEIAELATGASPQVRDLGLLDAAVGRPQTTVFGQDAYPDVFTKAAALLHSVVKGHPLVDGNKRLGWAACSVFYRKNDIWLEGSDDDAYDFVIAIAAGKLDEVDDIADVLRGFWHGDSAA
jgi:death-on-curing protein